MGWRRVFFYTLFILFKMVESSSRSGKMWLLNLSSEAAPKFSWTILSAGVFVFAALVLSTFLIIEHLASYNQPEVCCVPSFDWNSKVLDILFSVKFLNSSTLLLGGNRCPCPVELIVQPMC